MSKLNFHYALIQHVNTDKAQELFKASKSDECKAEDESTEDINKQIMKALKDLDCKVEPTHCCQVCGKMFSSPQDMMGHINAVHEKIESLYCEICGKYFTRKLSLSRHQKTNHHGRRENSQTEESVTYDFSAQPDIQIH